MNFIALLFIITQIGNNPNVHQLIKCCISIPQDISNKNEVLTRVITWMNLEKMLSQRVNPKGPHIMTPFIQNVQNKDRK